MNLAKSSFLLLLSLLMLSACGKKNESADKSEGGAAASGAKEINVYMWSEYIDPELLQSFEAKTGSKVRLAVYEATEEMIAKLQNAGGVSQYDVVVVSDHAIPGLAKLNLIQKLDRANLPNAKSISPEFLRPPYDPNDEFSIPYQWGTMGILYRKDRLQNPDPTWGLMFDPAMQPNNFILIDSMRDLLGAALRYRGNSINSRNPDELKAAGELALAAKKTEKCLGFEGGVGGKNRVLAGGASAAIVYNGDAVRAIDEDATLGFFVPREGSLIWCDAMVVPAEAPNPDGAHAFINFLLDPENGAKLSNFNRYATPNAESLKLISEADRANAAIYPSEETKKSLEYLEDLGPDTRLYDEVWTAVKSR